MKNIINKIERVKPDIQGKIVTFIFSDQFHAFDISANFNSGAYEVEIYDIKRDKTLSLKNKYFDKIIDYCKSLLDNYNKNINKGFTSEDRQDQRNLIFY